MRPLLLLTLCLMGCAGTLYQRYAGTVSRSPEDVYACVLDKLKSMDYQRTQYNDETRWYVAQKQDLDDRVSSGLYRKTLNILDTQVSTDPAGATGLSITAHTFQEFANQRGVDRQEAKASERVQLDARALAQACGT